MRTTAAVKWFADTKEAGFLTPTRHAALAHRAISTVIAAATLALATLAMRATSALWEWWHATAS
jgi:hypothetical protein